VIVQEEVGFGGPPAVVVQEEVAVVNTGFGTEVV
jgi:hypothetical protein